MTQEFESKVQDAVKMVMETISGTVEGKGVQSYERNAIDEMRLFVECLETAFFRGDMFNQKDSAKEIAAMAILYMVKFL